MRLCLNYQHFTDHQSVLKIFLNASPFLFLQGNKKQSGTVSGFQHSPTALTIWTLCRVPPPSTAADWAVTKRGLSHCGKPEPAQAPESVFTHTIYWLHVQWVLLHNITVLKPIKTRCNPHRWWPSRSKTKMVFLADYIPSITGCTVEC